MIIRDLSVDTSPEGSVTRAFVQWEDNAFPALEISFELRGRERPPDLPAHAFLCGCFPLAALHGERRLRVEGPCCPLLVEGLLTAHAWWVSWGGISETAPAIETLGWKPSFAAAVWKQGIGFVSGGVDGLHTLIKNHRLFEPGDPGYIQDMIFVHGFDIGTRSWRPENERFQRALDVLEPLLAQQGVRVVVCRTNLRDLPSKSGFWTFRHNGAALSAVGHLAAGGPAFLFIGSGYHLSQRVEMGSCPEVDPLFSSQNVSVVHFGARLTRVQKLRELAAWPAAINALRVCPSGGENGRLNCGICEKCLRTRLDLLVAGIDATDTLGASLTPVAQWEALPPRISHRTYMYEELLPALRARGLDILCREIEQRTATYQAWRNTGEPWPEL